MSTQADLPFVIYSATGKLVARCRYPSDAARLLLTLNFGARIDCCGRTVYRHGCDDVDTPQFSDAFADERKVERLAYARAWPLIEARLLGVRTRVHRPHGDA